MADTDGATHDLALNDVGGGQVTRTAVAAANLTWDAPLRLRGGGLSGIGGTQKRGAPSSSTDNVDGQRPWVCQTCSTHGVVAAFCTQQQLEGHMHTTHVRDGKTHTSATNEQPADNEQTTAPAMNTGDECSECSTTAVMNDLKVQRIGRLRYGPSGSLGDSEVLQAQHYSGAAPPLYSIQNNA